MNEALLAMYDRHRRIILSQLRGRVEAQDMEDVLHTVIDAIFEKIELLRELPDLRQAMYIRSIARNIAMDYLRDRVYRRANISDGPDEDMTLIADDARSVEMQVLGTDELSAMQAAIRRLPEEKRQLLEMKYLLEMTDAQIAREYGISRANVRQRLSRIRHELRARMEEMGYGKDV